MHRAETKKTKTEISKSRLVAGNYNFSLSN